MAQQNRSIVRSTRNLGLDTIAAAIGLVLGALLLTLRLFVSQIFVTTIPLVIGVASGLYLGTKRYGGDTRLGRQWRVQTATGHVLRLAVLVGLAGMIFVATFTGGRTVPFFCVATVVGSLIFGQIFFLDESDVRPVAVLAQIVGFSLVIRGTALLTTPGLIGVDSWVHIPDYAHAIRESGRLGGIGETKYYTTPLYHLLVVFAADMFDASLRTALYATLGIVLPLATLLIFYFTRYLLPVRWALFAAAAYAVADHFIRWGLHLIPTSMGLVFFIGVFYAVTRIYATRESLELYALVFFFTLATILTHQLSTFVTLVFLGAGVVAQFYLRYLAPMVSYDGVADSDNYVNFLGLFLVAVVLTVANWSISPGEGTSFLRGMIDLAAARLESAGFLDLASASTVSGPIESLLVTVPTSLQLLDALGFLMLLLVTLLGVFALLRHKPLDLLPLTWILATAVMLFVTLGLPLFGLYFLVPGRWYAFMYVLMVVLGAYGLQHLELTLPSRQVVAVLVVFTLLFTGPMLVNHSATRDNPVSEESYSQFAFSESELDAAETISTIHPESEVLRADHPYFLFYRNANQMTASPLEVNEEGAVTSDHVIYREYQSSAGPRVSYDGSLIRVQLSAEAVCRPTMDVRYSNGNVQYCQTGSL